MIEAMSRWFDSRLRLARFARRAFDHVFPDHWSFMLGEIALYSFLFLVFSGVYLAMFYNGSGAQLTYEGPFRELDGVTVSAAFRSVLHLSLEVPAGLLIRQMHHWAALVFVAAIVIHLARIFFTAAYRRPRELNWMIGLTLLLLAIANGYFGYSMIDDLLSGVGVRIAYAILLSVPIIGPWLTFIFFGGVVPSQATIPRMYMLHIFVIPALIAILMAAHIAIIWRQLHTNYPGPNRTNRTIVGSRLWPTYTAKSIGLCFLLIGFIAALGGLVQIDPIWIYGPNSPAAVLPGAQPDWYLGWIEGAMRLFPGVNLRIGGFLIPEVFFPAVLMPVLLFGLLYLYPFLDKWIISLDDNAHNVLRRPGDQPFNTAVGCTILVYVLVIFFAASDDVIALATGSSLTQIRSLLRILVFVAPAFTAVFVYVVCSAWRRHSLSHSRNARAPAPL